MNRERLTGRRGEEEEEEEESLAVGRVSTLIGLKKSTDRRLREEVRGLRSNLGEKIRTLPEEREIIRGGGERCRIERPICSGAEPLEDTISVSYDERKRYTRGEVNGQLWLEKLENLPPSRGVSGASCNQTGTTGFSSIDFDSIV